MDAAYPVILFYKYVPVAAPENVAAVQRAICTRLGLKGRILLAEEGINATLGGPRAAIEEYVAALKADARFADIEIKTSAGDEQTFPKLTIKVRREIVTLGAPNLASEQHNQLSPAAWKELLESDANAVALDVRNRYESAAGHFENAVACDIENFRELPEFVEQFEPLRDKTVLLYCTGGIRCEKASALLRSRGFERIFQLHGGIINYQEQFGNEHWLGECFVFDQRMTVRVENDLVPIGRCAQSGRATSRFVNCLHDPCHKLFLLSEEAEAERPDFRLCPECLAAGLTAETAEYLRPATSR